MIPSDYTLEIYRGDSMRKSFAFVQNNQPFVLTGVIPKAEIRDKPAGTRITPMTCTLTLPNIVDVFLAAADSHELPLKTAFWDLQFTYPSGDVQTPVAGEVTITGDVTDSTGSP